MEFNRKISENAKRLFSVYDVAAFCYDYLLGTVGDQEQFIGEYILYNKKASANNPNLKELRKFSREIEVILRRREEDGLRFSECVVRIQSCITERRLLEYGEPLLNEATIPLYILFAIDRYVQEKHGRCQDMEPLNKGYCENSYIYLNTGESIIDEAAQKNHFTDVILASTIRNQLIHLNILEKADLPFQVSPPQVVRLWIGKSNTEKQSVLTGKSLKIAVIPFSCANMLKFPNDSGALFHVEYNKYHIRTGIKRALNLLDAAIRRRANIIVFPEFICCLEIQRAIQERLRYIYQNEPTTVSSLLFVIAGSAWTEDNNNVALIFSYSGELVGRQYKFSKYSDLKKKGKEMIENLRNPGKETTIVEMEGIGKVLIGICRDVSARSYTRELARIFSPQLLLVPAWSKSVNIGFKEQFREITSENHKTCSILCNCCEASNQKKGFKKQIGLVTTPYKEGSLVIGKPAMLCREEEKCIEMCGKGGCIFLTEIDFTPEGVRGGENVCYEQYF